MLTETVSTVFTKVTLEISFSRTGMYGDGVQETKEKAMQYVKDEDFRFPVVYDTEMDAVSAYYVQSFPSTFFINANGELVTYANGMLDYDNLVKGIGYITE